MRGDGISLCGSKLNKISRNRLQVRIRAVEGRYRYGWMRLKALKAKRAARRFFLDLFALVVGKTR